MISKHTKNDDIISPCLKGKMTWSNAPNLFEIDWLFHHGWRNFWNRCCSNAPNRFKSFDYFTMVMEILKYDLLKCSKSLQIVWLFHHDWWKFWNMYCSNAPNWFEIAWFFHHRWRKLWYRCCSNAPIKMIAISFRHKTIISLRIL